MTTLAIIGSGILGRSLIYALAKEKKPFEKIVLFYSDNITPPCTLSSTAVVAPRGLSEGLSPLGDLLIDGFKNFSEHVSIDNPTGVEKIIQYTGATKKLDEFKKRYPLAENSRKFLKDEMLMQVDAGFLIDPKTYTDWLLAEAKFMYQDKLVIIPELVTEVQPNEFYHVKTINGRSMTFDKVVFTCGTYNRFWQNKTSKPVQGSYYEWISVQWDTPSFSLTLDGDNLIWDNHQKRLLIGSTSLETVHLLPPEKSLREIYVRLEALCDLKLPAISSAVIKVGLREKAQKREPYVAQENNKFFLGGLYKNGFTLALKIARSFSHQHL